MNQIEHYGTKIFGYIFTIMSSVIFGAMVIFLLFYIFSFKNKVSIIKKNKASIAVITKFDSTYFGDEPYPVRFNIYYNYWANKKLYKGNYYFYPQHEYIYQVLPPIKIRSHFKVNYNPDDPSISIPSFLYTFLEEDSEDAKLHLLFTLIFSIPFFWAGIFAIRKG